MRYKKYKAVEKLAPLPTMSQGMLPEAPYQTARPRRYRCNTESSNGYSTTYKAKTVCLNITYRIIGYY
jgi:hypothetical protein